MRRILEKSVCKCPRCAAKRRVRFLTVLGICIEMAAACYVLVDHSKPGVPPSSNAQEAPAEEPTLEANAIPEAKSEPLSMAATQPGTSWKQQDTKTAQEPMAKDGLSADSLERTENLTPPDDSRNLAYLLSSNLIGEVPMPHTNGWQTVPLAEVPRSAPKVDLQGTHQPDGAKVKAIVTESSPGPVNSEPPVRPSAEPGLHKDGEDVAKDYSCDPFGLLPRWLTGQSTNVDDGFTVLSPQEIPSPPMEAATSASTPVVASNPEINQTHAQANESSCFPAHRQDSTRVIRLKKPNVRYRSPAGLTSAEVKMRLIALWHQSLVRTKESRRWTIFSNLNRGERKKAAFIARTGP